MSDSVQWVVIAAPSLFIINWIAVLLAASALTWRRRDGKWPGWRPLAQLAGGIARNRRTCGHTLWIAFQLLMLDLLPPLAVAAVRYGRGY